MTRATLIALAALLPSILRAQAPSAVAALSREVFVAESSFAATMAARDAAAFARFIAPEAVFFGEKDALHGKTAVLERWARFFAGPAAPFSWRPERVEVLDSGTLAFSTGPVLAPDGRQVGTFNSVWRREPDGRWLVVFDKGCPVCTCGSGP